VTQRLSVRRREMFDELNEAKQSALVGVSSVERLGYPEP
jgi:hypothetical protein